MVQTAVRNLWLQTIKVDDDAMQTYVARVVAPPWGVALAHSLTARCVALDDALTAPVAQRHLDAIDDELLFLHDALRSARPANAAAVADSIEQHWLLPQLVYAVRVAREPDDATTSSSDESDSAASESATTSSSTTSTDSHAAALFDQSTSQAKGTRNQSTHRNLSLIHI